jgi:hypothetical protein
MRNYVADRDYAVELLTLTAPSTDPLPIVSPLGHLSNLLHTLSQNLEKVSEYVRQVSSGEMEGDERVGRFLLENVTKTTVAGSQGIEDEFNSHLSVRFKNLVQAQIEVAGRLALVPERDRAAVLRREG